MIAAEPISHLHTKHQRLGVVLVNWNRWADTIECLESLLRSTVPLNIIVVDNASADGSPAHILSWAEGRHIAHSSNPAMAWLTSPPLAKPIAVTRVSAAEVPALTPDNNFVPETNEAAAPAASAHHLTLIDAGGNLGFAGGNNLGLRLLMANPIVTHAWLLNNDTVVAPDTAAVLLDAFAAMPGMGQCGTTVRYYHAPTSVQALGGSRFDALSGRSWSIGKDSPATDTPDEAKIAAQLDFVLGASLAVSRSFLMRVGLMAEDYFLYFEEIDWAVRNRRLGAQALATGYAAKAIVWHKEGGSIGSASLRGERSAFSEYWLSRSRLAFTRHHYPLLLPVHWLLTLAYITRSLARRDSNRAIKLARALFGMPLSA